MRKSSAWSGSSLRIMALLGDVDGYYGGRAQSEPGKIQRQSPHKPKKQRLQTQKQNRERLR